MNINDRLKQLLTDLKISPAEFAEKVGINRSAVAHLLSGRNKPSVDVLEKILTAYPDWNIHWLIKGIGEPLHSIYSTTQSHSYDLFSSGANSEKIELSKTKSNEPESAGNQTPPPSISSNQKKTEISKIIMLNSDGTYSMYYVEKSKD